MEAKTINSRMEAESLTHQKTIYADDKDNEPLSRPSKCGLVATLSPG